MNVFERAANAVVTVVTDVATGGIAKYDPNTGKWDKGYTTHALDEGFGEVTGRNQLRAQMHEEDKRIADEQAQRDQERANELRQRANDDMAASLTAGAITGTTLYTPGMKIPKLGQTNSQQDLLGL